MKKGVALILTIVIVALAMAVVFSAAGIFVAELVASRNIHLSTVAFYIADAGIEGELYRDRILNDIPIDDPLDPAWWCNQPLGTNVDVPPDTCLQELDPGTGNKTYSYKVDGVIGSRTVTAVGSYLGTKRTIEINY